MPIAPCPRVTDRAPAPWRIATVLGVCVAFSTGGARADFRDEVGYTRLQAELGATAPTGAGVAVSQVEAQIAFTASTSYYVPDAAFGEFTGKTFIPKLTTSTAGVSWHATNVAQMFYGSASSVAPGITTIDVYEANDFASAVGFLRVGSVFVPRTETRAVQNHSWIGSIDNGGGQDVEALRRFDFAIQRDDFLATVGLNNGSASGVPYLLANAYNAVSVGLTNGQHSTGTSSADGLGRVKPEIVAPQGATSYGTPIVGAAAAMLRQNAPTAARHSLTLKAMLLAGATKDPFPTWNRTTTRPLDAHFGAGQVNVLNSYHILAAGQQVASSSVAVKPRGWDYSTTTASGKLYFFDIPADDTAPHLSALLTWNRIVAAAPSWPNTSSTLANLSLKLYAATGFTKGALIDQSVSTVDNLEHLYEPTLAPGRYALEVTGSTTGVTYGLAWYSLPTVSIAATAPDAAERGPLPGAFTVTRGGEMSSALTVYLTISGSAAAGADYASLPVSITIPANQSTATLTVAPVADALLEGDENVTVTIASDIAYAAAATGSATATIHDQPSFDAWRMTYFNAVQVGDPEVSGELADPNGNGLTNLLEYALHRDPNSGAATGGLPAASVNASGFPTLTYTAVSGATDIAYVVEVSTDLATWHSGPGYTDTAQISDNGITQTVTVPSALSTAVEPQQFLRLRVTRQ